MQTKELASKLTGSCTRQACELEERQRIRAKELVAIHGTIELRSDDDSPELFEETLPSSTLNSVDVKGLFDQRDELNQEIQAKVFE